MRVTLKTWTNERGGSGWATMPGLDGDVLVHTLLLLDPEYRPAVGDLLEIDNVIMTPDGYRATGGIALVPPNAPIESKETTDDDE